MSWSDTAGSSPSSRADSASRMVVQRMPSQSSEAAFWFPASENVLDDGSARSSAGVPGRAHQGYGRTAVDEVTGLALAARDGDRVALSSFVRLTWGDVSRLVTAVAGRDLAEDATQDAYLRALRALPRYRAEASARVWLLSIARRAAVDAVRSAGRRRRLARLLSARAEPEAGPGLADGVLSEQALALLDPDRRTAFALTQLLGFDYATAAEVCGCPVGTIRSRVARAREQLVAALGPVPAPSTAASTAPAADVAPVDAPAVSPPAPGS